MLLYETYTQAHERVDTFYEYTMCAVWNTFKFRHHCYDIRLSWLYWLSLKLNW